MDSALNPMLHGVDRWEAARVQVQTTAAATVHAWPGSLCRHDIPAAPALLTGPTCCGPAAAPIAAAEMGGQRATLLTTAGCGELEHGCTIGCISWSVHRRELTTKRTLGPCPPPA